MSLLVKDGASGELIDQARLELYRGQCNCSYWHGAFGGVYLPHLRNGVYQHLIAAENLLNQYENRGWQLDQQPWVEIDAADFNLDGRPESRLANNRLMLLASPVEGGQIYEFDVKTICHNLQATLTRRPEAYHRKVLTGPNDGGDGVASIHDKVVFKQEGLDERLQYDTWSRNSLVDHFYSVHVPREAVVAGTAEELGDFVHGPYEAKLRRADGRRPVTVGPRRQRRRQAHSDHQRDHAHRRRLRDRDRLLCRESSRAARISVRPGTEFRRSPLRCR